MSSIVIFVDTPTISADAIMELHRITKRSLGDIRNAISQGTPVFEREIFDGEYEEHASLIRAIIECLKNASVPCRVYEVPEGETMESCSFAGNCQIDIEVLNNILSQADAELDRQLGE